MIKELLGRKIPVDRNAWCPGDQRVFYVDIRTAMKDFGWEPKIGVKEGIKMLYKWLVANKKLF